MKRERRQMYVVKQEGRYVSWLHGVYVQYQTSDRQRAALRWFSADAARSVARSIGKVTPARVVKLVAKRALAEGRG